MQHIVSFLTLIDQIGEKSYHMAKLFLDYELIHFTQFQMQAGTTGIIQFVYIILLKLNMTKGILLSSSTIVPSTIHELE